jgi:hypothetical protein
MYCHEDKYLSEEKLNKIYELNSFLEKPEITKND